MPLCVRQKASEAIPREPMAYREGLQPSSCNRCASSRVSIAPDLWLCHRNVPHRGGILAAQITFGQFCAPTISRSHLMKLKKIVIWYSAEFSVRSLAVDQRVAPSHKASPGSAD